MDVANIARRLAAGELHYALGRFETVRRGYSAIRRLAPNIRRPSWPPPPTVVLPATLFPSVRTDDAVSALKRDSVAFGFDLPPSMVQEIVDFAETTPIRARGSDRLFRKSDVNNGRLPDGTPIVLALAPDPMECAAIRRVCRDPAILDAVTAFLGYRPEKTIPRLFWSFVTDASDDDRRRLGQTIDWHFDVHDFHFCSAAFYLTDVTEGAGAHALFRGSHKGKSLKMLLGSANATEEEVLARYGRDRMMVIEGPAGTGFLEDTSCYHKAIAPKDRDRLMFQIWFS